MNEQNEVPTNCEAANRPLRILHLATHTGVAGGGAVEMMNMARGFKERGHHVVCAFNWRDGRVGPGERNYEPITRHGIPCFSVRMEAFLSRLLGDQRRFRKLVQEHDFDIVHCHKQRAVRFALKALPDTARPAIVANHGNSYLIDDKGRKFYGNPRVRAILCVADELRQIAIRGGLDEAKVITNYTGINISEFDFRIDGARVRREFGISASAPVVGIIANFDGKKAHHLFFEAAVQIAAQVPDVRFLVVGRGAPAELPAQLEQMGIAQNVLLLGFRTDVPQLLAAMDVSVNASNRGEGLTGAMRESLAMKKAVVCTDIGGNRELVRDGETGRLVAPGDVPAFVEAVVELLRDKPRAQAMGEAGYALVQREFTQEVFVDKLEKIYRSLLV